MPLSGRDVISIHDLSDAEIEGVFALADELAKFARGRAEICAGKILATLFYEPSTRTRLSFESAMLRLGGGVLSCAEMTGTSVAKGETIADTVRIVESYADAIVIRHPLEGSAKVAADYAHVPVINAGDGGHEHPTQTLLDLYTIRREIGRIAGTWVALLGDLKHARTAHSLAYGLARLKANVVCVAPEGLEMPREVLEVLGHEYGVAPRQYPSLEALRGDVSLLESASRPTQANLDFDVISIFDAIYVTRVQRERFTSPGEFERVRHSYAIGAEILRNMRSDTLIMHPLPRVDELDYGIDADPRAAYFRQAAYGVPVRMALTAAVLGRREIPLDPHATVEPRIQPPAVRAAGATCGNPRCVTTSEHYLEPAFQRGPSGLRCAYCGRAAEEVKR